MKPAASGAGNGTFVSAHTAVSEMKISFPCASGIMSDFTTSTE